MTGKDNNTSGAQSVRGKWPARTHIEFKVANVIASSFELTNMVRITWKREAIDVQFGYMVIEDYDWTDGWMITAIE